MLSRIERCSSEVSWVTTEICARRLSCVTCGDVLAVDQDAAAFEIEEAQQQIDHGRLAGAGAADQADLLAAARPSRREGPCHARRDIAAVVEAHILESDLARA